MANLNVNLTQKLFAYIQHGVDITDQIKTNYKDSLIFIGDEQQIYNPGMNTYVGIGQTAYTNTLSWISNIDSTVKKMNRTMGADFIGKIYGQWDGFDSYLCNDAYASNNLTIKGIGDYDPNTHYAYTSYTITNRGTPIPNGTKDVAYTGSIYGTSGITVQLLPGYKEHPVLDDSGNKITTYFERNVLTIDDTLTWAYIANAYTYTLNYAREWGTAEANRIYHNLLGDSSVTYIPVSYEYSMLAMAGQTTTFVNSTTYDTNGNKLVDSTEIVPTEYVLNSNTKFYYKNLKPTEDSYEVVNGKVVDKTSKDVIGGFITKSDNTQVAYVWAELPVDDSNAANAIIHGNDANDYELSSDSRVVLYIKDNQYNSTYNINLADGIQTLKEVAYLLDVITDGWEQNTISYATYKSLPPNEQSLYISNPNPTTDKEYIQLSSLNNGGIQIAYSIANNQIQIDHLDHRIDKIESGENSLRSVQITNSKFAYIHVESNQTGIQTWDDDRDTKNINNKNDLNARHSTTGSTYVMGDVNLKLDLTTTNTYVTVANTIWSENETGNINLDTIYQNSSSLSYSLGSKYVSYLQKADNSKLDNSGTYYEAIISDKNIITGFTKVTELNTNYLTNSAIQYYWLPEGSGLTEKIYKAVTKQDVINDINSKNAFKQTDKVDTQYYYYDTYYDTKNNTYVGTYVGVKCSELPVKIKDNGDYENYDSFNDADGQTIDNYIAQKLNYWQTYGDKVVNELFIETTPVDKEHAILLSETSEDALATASWVTAYITDAVGVIASQNATLKEDCYNYTDKQISALDGYGQGTNSQYAFAYTEVNGHVGLNYRELPSDKIHSNVEVWGESNSYITKSIKQYVAIKKPESATYYDKITLANYLVDFYGNDTDDTANPYIHQVYYKGSETNIDPVYTYAAIDPSTKKYSEFGVERTINDNTKSNLYYYDDISGTYKSLDTRVLDENTAKQLDTTKADISVFDETSKDLKVLYAEEQIWNIHNPFYIQLYAKIEDYIEVDICDLVGNVKTVNNETKYDIKGIGTVSANGKVNYTVQFTDDTKLYIAKLDGCTNTVNYLSTTSSHCNDTNDGQGENVLTVTAHLTYIEDATATNTGLVDAYDVKSFINNYCSWVNISASISTSLAGSTDITVFDELSSTDKPATGVEVYKVAVNVTDKDNSIITNATYYMETSGGYLAKSSTELVKAGTDRPPHEIVGDGDNKQTYYYKYYTRKYNLSYGLINPINILETNYNANNHITTRFATV